METTGCHNRDHDHSEPNGARMTCGDCALPTHYDESVNDYRHDDPNAAKCFLIRSADGSECVR